MTNSPTSSADPLPAPAPTVPAPRDSNEPAMRLLQARLPLSLLFDLAAPGGPSSTEICASEGAPEDRWWEPAAR